MVRLREVSKEHYVVRGLGEPRPFAGVGTIPSPRLPQAATRFWLDKGLAESCGAIVSTDCGKLVGFFRYNLDRKNALAAHGTWVDASYRRQHLAYRMWRLAIRIYEPKRIDCVAASVSGKKFIEVMEGLFPEISFYTEIRF